MHSLTPQDPDKQDPFFFDLTREDVFSRDCSEDELTPSSAGSFSSQDYLNPKHYIRHTTTLRNERNRQLNWDNFTKTWNEWHVSIFKAYTPSFIHDLILSDEEGELKLPSYNKTEYAMIGSQTKQESSTIRSLDGLRGVACFFVFNFHFLYPFTRTIINSYGAPYNNGFDMFQHAHQLPFLSLLYRGRAMVAVFFAISGYVLSRKVLKGFRSGNGDAARRGLTSSIFRRAFRLYLPPTVSMFIVMIMVYLGMFLSEQQIYSGEYARYITGSWEEHPPRAQDFSNQLIHWYNMMMVWSNPFTWNSFFNLYDPHTWTIPIEFRSSIVLFAVLLGVSSLRSVWRVALSICMTAYCLKIARWDVAIFLGGMLICELDLIFEVFERNPQPQQDVEKPESPTANLADLIAPGRALPTSAAVIVLKCAILFTSLYLLSFPDANAKQTPGFMTLADYTPGSYQEDTIYLFWYSIGAVGLVWSVTNLSLLRCFFELGPFQYLGKISFAFYLVHGPILHSIGFMLMPEVWRLTGFENDISFVMGLGIGWLCLISLSIWCADLFWRGVDVPCTRIARKIERCLSSTTTSSNIITTAP